MVDHAVCRSTITPVYILHLKFGTDPWDNSWKEPEGKKTRSDLDKEILPQFLGKGSCVLLDSLSFEKYHHSRILMTDRGKNPGSPPH